MQSERAVPWTDLTENEQADFAQQHTRPGEDSRHAWEAQAASAQWRFYATCLDARIAKSADGVELIAHPLAVDPGHRAQHVGYSASLKLCVQRKGRFAEKRVGGKRVGWERRGEELLIGDALPTDLGDFVVVE